MAGVQRVDSVRVVGLHHAQIADVAAFHRGTGMFDGGEEPQPHALPAHDAGLVRRIKGLLGLVRGVGERLLAQDVLAGVDSHHQVAVVIPGLRRDVDDVDVRILAERPVRVIGGGNLVGLCEHPGAVQVSGGDGGNAGPRHVLQRFHPVGRDGRRADDSPTQFVVNPVFAGQTQADVHRRVHGPAVVHVGVVVDVVVSHAKCPSVAAKRITLYCAAGSDNFEGRVHMGQSQSADVHVRVPPLGATPERPRAGPATPGSCWGAAPLADVPPKGSTG